MGADDTPLNRAIGQKMLVAGVRRVLRPGCKFDFIVVLEGAQGTGKSTALRTLAGEDDFFSDQDIFHLDSKSQQEALRGKWIFEIAELAGLSRAETERTKAFISRTHDRARRAYDRNSIDQPRRCLFVGTTNDTNYLKDASGNRRFWPVKTGIIDMAALATDRDQLWAEAVAVEAAGEQLFLPDELCDQALVEQGERREDDPWLDVLADINGATHGDEQRVATKHVFDRLELPPARQMRHDLLRLRDCMRRLGWTGPEKMRVNGETQAVRGFRRRVSHDRPHGPANEPPF
jgi:predicted P-loop ATPase